jgi:spore germination cell wall hydrolase CwlJ-like protein
MAESKVNGLNIRSEKSTSSSKLATIDKGTRLEVIDQSDEKWAQVSFINKKGYISKEYLDIELSYKYAISVKEEGALQKAAAESKLTQAATDLTTTYGSKTTINAADMRLFVCLVFCESGSEPYQGKLAVANVVLNRYHSSRFPNTIKGVIYQSGQFSPTWNGQLNKKLATYDAGGFTAKNHLESIQAVKDALDGKNCIGDRLFFNGYNYEKNRGHQNAIRISNHLFW